MSRSGYVDSGDLDPLEHGRWRAQVQSSIRGKRGQAFLREILTIMDATPESDRHLIAHELIDRDGCCCTIGLVCRARKLNVSLVDVSEPAEVGLLVGVTRQLAAEIEYQNDEGGDSFRQDPATGRWESYTETTQERWERMRLWVERHIIQPPQDQPPQPQSTSQA